MLSFLMCGCCNASNNWQKQSFADAVHRKTPVLESLFNKVAGLQASSIFKKRLRHRCFSVNYSNFLKNTCFNKAPPVAASGLRLADWISWWHLLMRIKNTVKHLRYSFLLKQLTAYIRNYFSKSFISINLE